MRRMIGSRRIGAFLVCAVLLTAGTLALTGCPRTNSCNILTDGLYCNFSVLESNGQATVTAIFTVGNAVGTNLALGADCDDDIMVNDVPLQQLGAAVIRYEAVIPETDTYDRYAPRLNKHAAALVSEWADAVLFATRKIIVRTEDGSFNRTRTIAAGQGKDGGDRILRCIGGPSCIAKNRYNLPAELPLDWSALMGALSGTMNTTSTEGETENG